MKSEGKEKRLFAEVLIEPGLSHVGLALDAPVRVDRIALSGDVDAFMVKDIMVDGYSQLIRDKEPPKGTSIEGMAIWRTVNLILGLQKEIELPAAALDGTVALKLDTAHISVVVVVENRGTKAHRLAAEFKGWGLLP